MGPEDSPRKVNIGILGCGAVAYRWYLKGLTVENPDFNYDVIALCDVNESRARQASLDFNVKNFCTSKEDLLKYGVDLVVILTRHNDHFLHNKFFLDNGVNVYSEKPFASNYEEGKKLIEIAKSKGLYFGAAPQVMLSSRNQKVKTLIEDGVVGKISLVRASCSNLGPAGRSDTDYDPEWFYQEGGSLGSLGIYGLSALTWIFGQPVRVSAFQGVVFPEREVLYGPAKGKKIHVTAPDNVVAMMNYPDDMYVLFDGSYAVPNPPAYDFEIHGNKGSLYVGGFGGPESIVLKLIGEPQQSVGPNDDCHIRWNLSWGVEQVVNSIINNTEMPNSAKFALENIKLMEAMALSARENRHIELL
jgi:predicted dehydrogenase